MFISNEREPGSESYSVITLKGGTHLLSKSARKVLDQLVDLSQSLLKSWQNPTTVLLFQEGNSIPCSSGFAGEILSDLTRDELRLAIIKVRYICRAISKSPSHWIYCTSDDCLGIHAELAMSCSKFLCFSESLRLGFPEIRAGGFPVAGGFERTIRRSSKHLDSWENAPVQMFTEPGGIGPDVLLRVENWKELIESSHVLSDDEKRRSSDTSKDPLLEFYESCIQILPPLSSEISGIRNFWEEYSSKIKKSHHHSKELARWIVDAGAAQFFSEGFIRKVEKQGDLPSNLTSQTSEGPLYIDLNKSLIPTSSLCYLLESQRSLMMIADDSASLKKSLELVYLGLERRGQSYFLERWKVAVRWAVTKRKSYMQCLSWGFDRRFSIHYLGEEYCGLCLVEGSKRFSVIEFRRSAELVSPIVGSCGLRVICLSSKGYLSDFVRNWALEELYSLSKSVRGGLPFIMKSLTKEGWRFLGSVKDWENQLEYRSGREVCTIEAKPLDIDILGIPSWKSFVRKCGSDGDYQMSELDVSYHFEVLSIVMLVVIEQELSRDDRQEIGVLISSALGLPYGISLPGLGQYHNGLRKVDSYIEEKWSRFWHAFREGF